MKEAAPQSQWEAKNRDAVQQTCGPHKSEGGEDRRRRGPERPGDGRPPADACVPLSRLVDARPRAESQPERDSEGGMGGEGLPWWLSW